MGYPGDPLVELLRLLFSASVFHGWQPPANQAVEAGTTMAVQILSGTACGT